MRKSTKLPDGVGKKIIEALKSQPQSTNNRNREPERSSRQQITQSQNPIELEWEEEEFEQPFQQQKFSQNNFNDDFAYEQTDQVSNYIVDEDENNEDYDHYQNYQQEEYEQSQYEEYSNPSSMNDDFAKDMNSEEYEQDNFYEEYQQPAQEKSYAQSSLSNDNSFIDRQYREEPAHSQNVQLSPSPDSNVNILMNLVYQLPHGVTKQTGAQIIRQTMEAMGISMNKVLSEAQHIQQELGSSIKDNINTIEEYRNNIKNLEKDVQICRKKCEELEELVGLFTLSEM